jgi:hypothetical protein
MGRTVVTWLVLIVIIIVAWKVILPRVQGRVDAAEESPGAGGGSACVKRAQGASEKWGSGIGQFVNPPYDMEAWSMFKNDVDARIDAAESECACDDDACQKAGEAMRELRSLVSEIDNSMRNNARPPDDMVQRQEGIDNKLDQAAGQ